MKSLEDLRKVADETLGGLNATPGLKYRILQEAEKNAAPKKRRLSVTALTTAVASAACALVIAVGVVPAMRQSSGVVDPKQNEDMSAGVMAARSVDAMAEAYPEEALDFAEYAEEEPMLISTMAAGADYAMDAAPAVVAVNSKSVTVSGRNASELASIWAEGSGAFPLIRVNGRYYRMLTEPSSVPASVKGSKLGTISEYTLEPALSSTDAVMSNIALAGCDVWEVSGMGGTMVAAEVNGSLRAFQRVSFSGSALRGSEGLRDTLQLSGHIVSITLSDVGTVTGSDCERLYSLLCSGAAFESSGSLTGRQSLLFELDNGLAVQLAVKGDRVAACGVWSCPEFFDAFSEACN